MRESEQDPEMQRKARRVTIALYVMMVVMVLLPLVLWWVFRRDAG